MAIADTRRSKRRKLSPAEEDIPQPSKRKSNPTQSTEKEEPTNGSNKLTVQGGQHDQMPPVKGLDSSEPAVRRLTMKTILEHLRSRTPSAPLTSIQCLQLWRGFSVAIYMHDSRNALSVQNILREIAGTFITIAEKDDQVEESVAKEASSQAKDNGTSWLEHYHNAFWETISREWATIDSHRMNKYLLLVRFVLRAVFTISLKPCFDLNRTATATSSKSKTKKTKNVKDGEPPNFQTSIQKVDGCIKVLEDVGPLNPSQRKISDGLRLHVLDIWSDELFGALNDLEETYRSAEGGESGAQQVLENAILALISLRDSVEKISKSDSGAQRHVRLRAKDAVKAINEQMETRSLNMPV